MSNQNQDTDYHNNNIVNGLAAGMLIGGLVGAGAMLLLAPQSGERTREQIQERSIELRDETSDVMDAAMAKAWLAKNRIARNARRKTNELIHQGQALVNEQAERVSKATKTWVKTSHNS
jgi:gas vesicle protein